MRRMNLSKTRHLAPLIAAAGMIAVGAVLILVLAVLNAAPVLDPNNPTGAHGLILIDKLGHTIRFFDPSTFKEISSFETAVTPHDVAISPDHKTAYAPIYGDGVYGRNPHPAHEIAIIDLASRKQTGTIDVSPYIAPHGIQIDQKGMLYVTCDLSRKLLVIDPKKRSIVAAIDNEGTGHWIAVLPDASKAYVTNKNDRLFVSVIDLKLKRIVARVPTPNGTQGVVASPDGSRVLVMDNGEPVVLVIDTKTDTVVDKITLEGNTRGGYKPRYSLDGSTIVTMTENPPLVNVIDAKNLHWKQQVFPVGKDPMGFAFAPDGKTLLVANHGDGTVTVIDLKASKVVDTFKAGTGIETLSYY
jgi:YVTN family beta-propeller protein